MNEKKCPHNGLWDEHMDTCYDFDDDGRCVRERTHTARGWIPGKCLGEQCGAWYGGQCHYGCD